MQGLLDYYITNEIRIRSKTSILLWCYYSSVIMIFLPHFLEIIYLQRTILLQPLLNVLLPIFLLFFPLNLDLFSRERRYDMSDHVIMNSESFKQIYLARIVANALLMIIPIVTGYLCLLGSVILVFDPPIIFQFLIYNFIIPPYFFSWFFIAVFILSIIDLKVSDSLFRYIFFYFVILVIFVINFVIKDFAPELSPILAVFLGQQLFDQILLTITVIAIIFALARISFPLVLTKQIDLTIKQTLVSGLEMESKSHFPKYDLYQFLNRKALWKKLLLFIGCFLYFYVYTISITFSDSSHLIELFIDVLGFHFFVILLYVLFFVFPQITIEKKFNMEELLLSRISVYHYFFEKLLLLVKSIFYPTLAAIITIILLSRSFAYSLVLIIAFVIVQTLYFVSILLFFWRFFATKSLLQSTFLSILGVEIVGYFISNFLFSPDITGYRTTALFFSPLFSSLEMTKLILKSSSDSILYWALWLHLILSIAFYFASVVLLKSEVRFE